jgi:hypothetical protein
MRSVPVLQLEGGPVQGPVKGPVKSPEVPAEGLAAVVVAEKERPAAVALRLTG